MEEKRLKIDLELHVVGDGRIFLNFWNHINGDDAIAEFKNGKLYNSDGNFEEEILLQEFIDKVREKVLEY